MMKSKSPPAKNLSLSGRQHGFSIIEIMIVVLIMTVIVTFAIISFGTSKPKFNRQNLARQLKIALEHARFNSVKRRASDPAKQASVVINSNSFSLTADDDGNNTFSAGETTTTSLTNQDLSILADNMTFPVTIKFNYRGEITATWAGGTSSNPQFLVCNGVCDTGVFSTANTSKANRVLVSPAGTVDLLAGTDPVPGFQGPGVSNISTNTNIKVDVVITPTP